MIIPADSATFTRKVRKVRHMKRSIALSVIILFLSFASGIRAQADYPVQDLDCFSIIVGKQVSADGAILLAHNEDDWGKQLVNWKIQEAMYHHEGTEISLKNGGRLAQVERTNKFFWLEIPGMDFSDSYLNEHGVCITSNSCPSREDQPEITDGGIGYRLRGIMAERASTAREAVRIGGQLIEQFGYLGSGRTYSIVGPEEAWVLSAVKGKHWVAARIPDDQVMVLPNNYTITAVDLNDSYNFMGSKDLIAYAIERGWYDPASGQPFSFRDAYASEHSLTTNGNRHRAWGAYYKLGLELPMDADFPFLFKPKKKISKQDLMDVLAYHYEGTELDKSKNYLAGSPYELNGSMICGSATVYGFVTEFRNWLPPEIGVVMWLAPQWPDIQPFIPYYSGIQQIPEGYCEPGYNILYPDFSLHYAPPADIHDRALDHYFWYCVMYSDYINADYAGRIEKARKIKGKMETAAFRNQEAIDKVLLDNLMKNPDIPDAFMEAYTFEMNEKMRKRMRRYIK